MEGSRTSPEVPQREIWGFNAGIPGSEFVFVDSAMLPSKQNLTWPPRSRQRVLPLVAKLLKDIIP